MGSEKPEGDVKQKCKIIVSKDGPYLVSGGLPLDKQIIATDKDGRPEAWKKGDSYPAFEKYSLCRCGQSKGKPYCDGTHARIGFIGTETASRRKYEEQANTISGPKLDLKDAVELCALGRFCERAGGVWALTRHSDKPESRKAAIQEACDCPSGRLLAIDKKSGKGIEPRFKPSISLVEDPGTGTSGPIWVKGGVPIESQDGKKYETRNRVALCRCGNSGNKPFCNGSHIQAKFRDGDKSLKE
jgi:CDGSH-type Zn-finger protein